MANRDRLVFWIKGARGIACLKAALEEGKRIVAVCLQDGKGTNWYDEGESISGASGIPVHCVADPNDPSVLEILRRYSPDVFVLAGYGKILQEEAIGLPAKACINLHGGRLPSYRGSSPMNWALLNGESEFGISVIKVAPRVDAGDVLAEHVFPIGPDDTIRDLHKQANEVFPSLLMGVIESLENNTVTPIPQELGEGAYYPMRFPDDGLIMFDAATARQVHNKVRALTEPYPCAYSYYGKERVRIVSSHMAELPFYGEPGRIYQIKDGSILVCAMDRALWLDDVRMEDGRQLSKSVVRYERLATVCGAAELMYQG